MSNGSQKTVYLATGLCLLSVLLLLHYVNVRRREDMVLTVEQKDDFEMVLRRLNEAMEQPSNDAPSKEEDGENMLGK